MPDLRAVPTLAGLLDAPERAADLSPTDARELLRKLVVLVEELRLAATAPAQNGDDEWLDAEQAAQRVGVSTRYLYAHADTLPYAKRVGRRVLFSARGIERDRARRRA